MDTVDTASSAHTPLDAPRLVRRLSLDLRGTLPSVDELDRVEADPSAVSAIRAEYLADPLHEERLVLLFQERWHTRIDVFDILADDVGLDTATQWTPFARALGEEPLRLLAYVGARDLPWTDIVTTELTLSNDLGRTVFPVQALDPDATGWAPSVYTDGRPAVGVLATNGLWLRYPTDAFNLNRRRAAAISRLLLCDDYLARPVRFTATQSVLEDTDEALRTDPACLSCHASLDPLAASLFGFWWLERYNPLEALYYHPERERMGPAELQVDAAWFGEPVDSLAEVGVFVANDPRFARCAAQTVSEALLRRPLDEDDTDTLEDARRAFVRSDLRLSALLVQVTDTPEYRAGASDDDRALTTRLVTADKLGPLMRDLTGVGFQDVDTDWTDVEGRALGGAVDGWQTFTPQRTPSLTTQLLAQRYSQIVAAELVPDDLAHVDGVLLDQVDMSADEAAVRAQLDALSWRLFAVRPDAAWTDSTWGLWQSVESQSGPEAAWQAVVSALLQDPLFVSY
jgi:hypothetical protein